MAVTIEELEIIVKANVEQAMREVEKFKPYMEKAFASLAPAIERQGKAINKAFSVITPEVQNTAKQTKQAVESMQKDYENLAKAKKKEAEESKKASRLTEEEMKHHAELAKKASDEYNARFQTKNSASTTYSLPEPTKKYSLATSVEELKKAVGLAEPEIENLSNICKRLDGTTNAAMENLNNRYQVQVQQLQRLKEQYANVLNINGSDSMKALKLQDKIFKKESDINILASKMNKLSAESSQFESSLKNSETPMQKINKAAESAKEPIQQMARYAQAAKAPLQQMGAAIEQSAKKTNNFRSVFKKLEQQAKASTTKVKNMFGDLGRAIKQAITIGVLYKGFGKLFSFISNGIQDAIDAPEIQNMFAVALGNMAGQAEQFAQRLKESLGLDEYATKNMLGTFQNMITSMGIGDKTALNMSESLTLLANDMASLYNVPVDQAFENLQSALTGQGEAVKKYGYIVNEATKQEAALRFGLIKEGQTLTEAQKPLAAYLVLLSQSGNAQGDMSRTITSLQNQIRIFQQNMQAAGRSIGSAFEPIIQSVIPWLNGLAIVLQRVGTQLARFTYSLFGMDYDAEMKKREQSIADAAASAGKAQNTFGNAVDKTAKQVKGALASFDELHVIQKNTADSLTDTSAGGYEVPGIPTLEMPKGKNPFEKYATSIEKLIRQFKKHPIVKAFGKAFEFLWDIVFKFGKWIINNPSTFLDFITTIFSAIVAYKVAKTIIDIANAISSSGGLLAALKKLVPILSNPWAIAIGAVAGAIVGLGIAFYNASEKEKQADLAKRFGDVALSMEEIEDVAKRLTNQELSAKISIYVEQKEKLSDIENQIKDSLSELNKLNWKVSVGLKLTDEEKENYKTTMDSFINSSIQYVEQKQYVASLALDVVITDNENFKAEMQKLSNDYFLSARQEMENLGKKLRATINDALADGKLDKEELKTIENLQKEIAEIQKRMADAEYRAELNLLTIDYKSVDLDAESFKGLTKKMQELAQQQIDGADDAYKTASATLILAYDAKLDAAKSEEEKQKLRQQFGKEMATLEDELNTTKFNITLDNASFSLEKLSDKYKAEIDKVKPQLSKSTQDAMEDGFMMGVKGHPEQIYSRGLDQLMFDMTSYYRDAFRKSNISKATKDGLNEMLKELEPSKEQLQKIYDDALTSGKTVPKGVAAGLDDYQQLNAVAGNIDAMFYMMGQKLSSDPKFLELLSQTDEAGKYVNQSFLEGMKSMIPDLKKQGNDLIFNLDSAIQNANNNLVNNKMPVYGKNVVEGLNKGINNYKESSKKVAMQWIEDGVIAGAKIALDIHSPSKVMEKYGEYVVKGFNQGIEKNSGSSKKVVKSWYEKVGDWFKDFFGIHSPSAVFAEFGNYIVLGLNQGIQNSISSTVKTISHWNNAIQGSASTLSLSADIIPTLKTGSLLENPNKLIYKGDVSPNTEIFSIQEIFYEAAIKANYDMVDTVFECTDKVVKAIDEKNLDVIMDGESVAEKTHKYHKNIDRRIGTQMITV